MTRRTKQIAVGGVLAVVLGIGAGAAVAGGGLPFGSDRQAYLNDAAKRLDVTPAQLEAALRGAYDDRIDAAVAAGKITKEQGAAMKARAAKGGLPLFGGPHRGGFGQRGHVGAPGLAAAATYLGLTEAALRTELQSGKSLADVAKAKGKSVADLKKAIAAEMQKKLDAAVKAGRLTQAQADEMEARTAEHLDDLVNGTGGPRGHHGRHGGNGFGGSPSGTQPGAAFAPVPAAGSPA